MGDIVTGGKVDLTAQNRMDVSAQVYTGDFQHGRDIEGVRIVNPFAGRS